MKQTKKRGFTIVELVIVIAVIAILAAVLIPTFSSLIEKANTSADVQMVRTLNTIVALEGPKTPHDAIVAAEENGYKVEKITPTSANRTIAWDGTNCRFVLLDESKEEIFPNDDKSGTTPIANIFILSDTCPAEGFDGYAVYLKEGYAGATELSVATGLDVGANTNVTSITYTGSDDVVIRTNGDLCVLTVSGGTVHHYGMGLYDIGAHDCHAELHDESEYTSADEITTLFAGGKGTEEAPYLIATEEQLKNLEELSGQPTYLKLVDDITFVTNEDEDGEYGYIYTYFQGVLDGDGHSIINTNSDTTAPCLFYGTYYGDVTIKNLNYVMAGDVVKPLFYRNYSGYHCDGTALTIENVTISGAEEGKIYDLCGYGYGPFMLANSGAVYFKNCVNEVSYTIPGEGYCGIFIGNFGYPETFASFENCVNKGTINGVAPGFFCGNETRDIELTNSNATPVFSSTAQVFYISNCSNEGVLIGSDAVGAFGCNWPDVETSHDICDAALTEAQFHRGTMIVGDISVGLTFNGNDISIVTDGNSNIAKYSVAFDVYLDMGDMGNSRFSYVEYFTPAEVAGGKTIANVTSVITRADYEDAGNTFDEETASISTQYKYIVVNNDDGTRTLVVDVSHHTGFESFGEIEYRVSAYDANGLRIASKQYR